MEIKTNYFVPTFLSFIAVAVVLICWYFIIFPRDEKKEITCPACPPLTDFQKEILKKIDDLNIKLDKKTLLLPD